MQDNQFLPATPPTDARVQRSHCRALTEGVDLQDATELTDLWANIDSLFAGGDVHRIAAALGTMSRSAPLVADMPGLQEMPSRLPVRTQACAWVWRCASFLSCGCRLHEVFPCSWKSGCLPAGSASAGQPTGMCCLGAVMVHAARVRA